MSRPTDRDRALADRHNALRPLTDTSPGCRATPLGNCTFRLDAPGATAAHVSTSELRQINAALESLAERN